jgi:3-oxoacyl-[acyl-carrier protein] reductase
VDGVKRMRLKGKVSIVTGAGRGIGRAVASAMADEGAYVIVNYAHSKTEAEQLVSKIGLSGREAVAFKADVSRSDEVRWLVQRALNQYGTVDVLVNNAGVVKPHGLMEISEEEWDYVLDVNLKSAFLCSQEVAKIMLEKKSGKIINISSVGGALFEASRYPHYAAAKAGVVGLTKSLANNLAPDIQVNAIVPGLIETDMTSMLSEEKKREIIGRTLLNRTGKPEDIAKVAVFLASHESDFITGEVIFVTGGRS